MRKKVLLFICLSTTLLIHAAVTKTVSVSAGTLSTTISATEVTSVTDLVLSGSVDARDFKYIRDNMTNLASLDLSGISIKLYAGKLGTDTVWTTYPANELPKYSFCDFNFVGNNQLKTVILPSSLTSIGYAAFQGCSTLTSINLPDAVTNIGNYAFFDCAGLTSIKIPNAVKTIGDYAFGNCKNISSINIPNTVTAIGIWAFCNDTGLTSLTVPNSVTSIGGYAFFGCSGLTALNIPTSVTSIGEYAFSNCNKLTNVSIPNSIKAIPNGLFSHCLLLSGVTLPSSITSIGNFAFEDCAKLTGVNIPSSVLSIGESAFYNCTGITAIAIPSSVSTIGRSAFLNTGIKSITIQGSVKSIDLSTFSNCSNLTSAYLSDSVTSIGNNVFYDCDQLTGITIGKNISSIGNYAFNNCNGLTSIKVYATKPATLSSSAFSTIDKSLCTLSVPKSAISTYKATAGWNEFTNIVEISSIPSQDIPLASGWNIISTNIVPSNPDLKAIFQPLIDQGKLQMVIDESGKMLEYTATSGGWKNDIGNFNKTEGYKVFMENAGTLSIAGTAVQLPLNVNLNAGWNIISYPCVNEQDALSLIQPLINKGNLKKVMDESGKSIEDFGSLGGWKNNIGNFAAGKGFRIYMSKPDTLLITGTGTRSSTSIPDPSEPAHFEKVYQGNGTDHMNINLVNLNSSIMQAGDEIGIFDGNLCIGAMVLNTEQMLQGYISIPASCNDGLQGTANGFTPGNKVSVKLYSGGSYYNLVTEKLSGSDVYEKGGSLFANVLSKELLDVPTGGITTSEKDVQIIGYPNPFVEEISIHVRNTDSTRLTVDIYNLYGQRIKRLYQGEADDIQLEWNGKDEKGVKVVPGLYLCKANGSTFKIVLADRQ